ncbi:MAG: response regulator [Parvibaculum sp.]|nr:response regulator [Parvibaculum sp.]
MHSVLVIDDEDALRETLCVALAAQGFRAIGAADGKDGLRKFSMVPVSLVLTDLVMPELDGIGLIREIKRAAPNIPVIAMSGWQRCGVSFYLDVAKALGADDALVKPFTIRELRTRIDRCLAA